MTGASHCHAAVAVAVAVGSAGDLDGLFSVPSISAYNGTREKEQKK
jgi:hypothetical protein